MKLWSQWMLKVPSGPSNVQSPTGTPEGSLRLYDGSNDTVNLRLTGRKTRRTNMGNFDDVQEMGKLVELMDENPEAYAKAMADQGQPAPAAEGNDEPAPEYEQVAEPEAQENLSGGLSDALEVEEDAALTLDDILGIDAKDEAPKAEETPVASGATEEAVETKTSSVEERLAEMAEERKALREQVDLLTQRALQEPPAKEADSVLPPEDDINPDVDEYFKPIVDRATAPLLEKIEQLETDLAPTRKEQGDRMMGEAIAERVEGFKPEHLPKLYEELDKMSDENKATFGGDFAGAIALAGNMVNRGAFSDAKPEAKTSPLASRSHSESSGPAPGIEHKMSDEEKYKRLMAMPNDQFLAQLDKMDQGEY